MTAINAWQLPDGPLILWHNFRIPIVLIVAAFVIVTRISLYARSKRRKRSLSSLVHLKASEVDQQGKAAWSDAQLSPTKIGNVPKNHNVDVQKTQPLRQGRSGPRRVTGSIRPKKRQPREAYRDNARDVVQPMVFFSSISGSTEKAAHSLATKLFSSSEKSLRMSSSQVLSPQVHDLSYINLDDYFITPPKTPTLDLSEPSVNIKYFYIILFPTYDVDTALNNFLEHLKETHNDFRIDTAPMSSLLAYSVFGFGDRDGWPTEEEGFCSQAKEVDKWMAKLTGGKRAYPLGMGNVKGDAMERLNEWRVGLGKVIEDLIAGKGLGEGVVGSGDAVESDEEDGDDPEGEDEYEEGASAKPRRPKNDARSQASRVDDLEDVGRSLNKENKSAAGPLPADFTTYSRPQASETSSAPQELKEMVPVSSPTHAALTKQGYTIVGSHSGVKICRWTKSALRGRGSCYKYSFYGIQSHLCMETTPSLSCSNKCVFCWRHGTNPVGTTWRWRVDPPDAIFAGVKAGHYQKIKMLRGVPGVRADRFEAAQRIQHCALSLVGEPLFYPHINALLALLHAERISTFLVCNAQHPAQLAALAPVTQLYVSIDASNAADLRRIDRPLHRDFWARFTACIDIVREKRRTTRTVFRLTLVKGFNLDEEVAGYAALVARGLPCFVEIKGVTYCGTSSSAAAGLTMQNVPFYAEVCVFATALDAALAAMGLEDGGYGIAAEHAHSCCVLIASTRFVKQGRWHTLIDYGKFFECLESGREFGPEDYVGAETPEWALWGNGGFDPRDQRVVTKGKGRRKVVVEGGKDQEGSGTVEELAF